MSRLRKFHTEYLVEAGCDEAGRGCLAGPVVAAAVVFPPDYRLINNLNDSKLLKPEQREKIAEKIKEVAVDYAVSVIDNGMIDKINIVQASVLAMNNAVASLKVKPDQLLIDGNYFHSPLKIPFHKIVKGDTIYASIAAASILAKVHRDQLMKDFHEKFPFYDWFSNKGYSTPKHWDGITKHGICDLHRRTFVNLSNEKQLEIW